MSPIFNSDKIIGAFENEKTSKVQVNFRQVFELESLTLNKFIEGCAFCNFGKYLYCSGGKEMQKGFGLTFYRVSISKNDNYANIEKLPYMIEAHWNHSIISNGYYLFAIGGYNSNKCEYFNFQSNEWKKMADLQCKERQKTMLALHKNFLYAFMGISQNDILSSVERINIENLDNNIWEIISVLNPHSINLKFWGAGIYEHNDTLLFVGGKYGYGNTPNDFKKEVYCFACEEKVFSETNIIAKYLFFLENKLHYLNKEKIANFIYSKDVHLTVVNPSDLVN